MLRPMFYVMLAACGVEAVPASEPEPMTDGGLTWHPVPTTSAIVDLQLDYCQEPGDDPDGCCALYLGCDTTGKPTCTSPPPGTCYELTCQSSTGVWFLTGACR